MNELDVAAVLLQENVTFQNFVLVPLGSVPRTPTSKMVQDVWVVTIVLRVYACLLMLSVLKFLGFLQKLLQKNVFGHLMVKGTDLETVVFPARVAQHILNVKTIMYFVGK